MAWPDFVMQPAHEVLVTSEQPRGLGYYSYIPSLPSEQRKQPFSLPAGHLAATAGRPPSLHTLEAGLPPWDHSYIVLQMCALQTISKHLPVSPGQPTNHRCKMNITRQHAPCSATHQPRDVRLPAKEVRALAFCLCLLDCFHTGLVGMGPCPHVLSWPLTDSSTAEGR